MSDLTTLLGFVKAIERDPRNGQLRMVYADWLDERGLDDEAAFQRKFDVAKYNAEVYLRHFCKQYVADYDELLKHVSNGEGYYFGSTSGPHDARWSDEFWDAVELLSGKKDIDRDQHFACGC